MMCTAFDYLVKFRYLAGSPLAAVKDPVVTKKLDGIRSTMPSPRIR